MGIGCTHECAVQHVCFNNCGINSQSCKPDDCAFKHYKVMTAEMGNHKLEQIACVLSKLYSTQGLVT